MFRFACAWFAWLTWSAGTAVAQPEPTPPPEPPAPIDPAPAPIDPAPVPIGPAPAPAPAPAPEPEPPLAVDPDLASNLQIHGFVTQGGFISTANDYLGKSSRGSLELFEAGLNVSKEVADRLRVGMQLFSRDVGKLGNYALQLDWAFVDYKYRPWLGFRAGHIKLPFGLYNEYSDIDSGRLAILMPQSVYPIGSRDVLLAHTGFAAYGTLDLGSGGELDYQGFLGTFFIDPNTASTVGSVEVDSRYVAGGQAIWSPPVEGLRIGASGLRASIDYALQLDQKTIDLYIALGIAPADFDGRVGLFLRPAHIVAGSVEYIKDRFGVAAEYSRWLFRIYTKPEIIPLTDTDSERFYVRAGYRVNDEVAVGAYYSVNHVEAGDHQGRNKTQFPVRERAFQRDLAATLRYDVNEFWLWKLEAHFIDGAADLDATDNPMPERYWGMFLARTTLTF